jgi:hypothetical protein
MEYLSDEQSQWVMNHWLCPDCKKGKFLKGPRGPGAFNVMCDNTICGQRFWISEPFVLTHTKKVFFGLFTRRRRQVRIRVGRI